MILSRSCRLCGDGVSAGRDYCDACLPERRAAHLDRFAEAGPAALARLRATGRKPGHDGASAAKRSATYRRRRAEQLAWDREHREPADQSEFIERILPGLLGVTLTELQKATGLSRRYCSLIRRGLYVPHRRW